MEDLYPVENIFNRENPQNSEPQNGPRRGLDFIALGIITKQQMKPLAIRTYVVQHICSYT